MNIYKHVFLKVIWPEAVHGSVTSDSVGNGLQEVPGSAVVRVHNIIFFGEIC